MMLLVTSWQQAAGWQAIQQLSDLLETLDMGI
jgi:hypothetical protein